MTKSSAEADYAFVVVLEAGSALDELKNVTSPVVEMDNPRSCDAGLALLQMSYPAGVSPVQASERH
jgi:hypothetical protein